jgi:hypothetical protein
MGQEDELARVEGTTPDFPSSPESVNFLLVLTYIIGSLRAGLFSLPPKSTEGTGCLSGQAQRLPAASSPAGGNAE